MNIRITIPFLLAFSFHETCLGSEHPPADHAGADLTLADGDVIWGLHTNIGSFTIPTGAMVSVKSYDGTNRWDVVNTSTGTLNVEAHAISILGTLSAEGAGYSGGGGGGGGGTTGQLGGLGGAGRYPVRIYYSETAGQGGQDGFCGLCGPPWAAGQGAPGDGFLYGSYIQAPPDNWQRACGGYMGFGANADTTTDGTTVMGSGGAGSGGSSGDGAFCGYGGASGGSGGGLISLVAMGSLAFGPEARVDADGVMGNPRDLSTPICCSIPGNPGQNVLPPNPTNEVDTSMWWRSGGAGAGGGIMLKCTAFGGMNIAPGAEISTLGGGDLVVNGGTVKLFFRGPASMSDNIFAGRVFIGELGGASAAVGWEGYE